VINWLTELYKEKTMIVSKSRCVAIALGVLLAGFGAPRAMAQDGEPVQEDLLVLKGTEDLRGYGPLTFRIVSKSKVQMIDKDGTNPGVWEVNGNRIRLFFYDGSVVYEGSVNGNSVSGTATNGKTKWNWRVQTQGTNDSGDSTVEENLPPARMPAPVPPHSSRRK
jgi:hypothetical protein